MSHNLNVVTLDFLENNRKLCNSLVESYRRGGQVVAKQIESGWERAVAGSPADAKSRRRLIANGHAIGKFLSNRVTLISDTADSAFNKACDGVSRMIGKLSSRIDAVDNRYLDTCFGYIGAATLPAAKLAANVSGRIAEGAQRMSGKSIARKAKTAARRPAGRVPAARKKAHAK